MLTLFLAMAVDLEVNRGFQYGSDLLSRCTAGYAADEAACLAYITGVHDSVRAYEEWGSLREVCSPGKTRPMDLRNTVVDYLTRNADYLTGQAASVIILALREKYPCSLPR